jgi:hypothetical protein
MELCCVEGDCEYRNYFYEGYFGDSIVIHPLMQGYQTRKGQLFIQDLNSDCQSRSRSVIRPPVPLYYDFNGKKYCIFHVPKGEDLKAEMSEIPFMRFLTAVHQKMPGENQAIFQRVYFPSSVNLQDCLKEKRFPMELEEKKEFYKLKFENCVFSDEVKLSAWEELSFINCTFKKGLHINFSEEAHTLPNGEAIFLLERCSIEEGAEFFCNAGPGKIDITLSGCAFKEKVTFSIKELKPIIRLTKECEFKKSFETLDVKFNKGSSFEGAIFEEAPQILQCEFYEDIRFPPLKNFKDISSKNAEKYYEAILNAAKEVNSRDEISKFNILYERSKLKGRWKLWRLSAWYDLISLYGTSSGRPFIILMAFIFGAWLAFLLIDNSGQLSWAEIDFLEPTRQAGLQIFKPFSVWTDECVNVWMLLTGLIETLSFLICFSLFLLAIRWRFRR